MCNTNRKKTYLVVQAFCHIRQEWNVWGAWGPTFWNEQEQEYDQEFQRQC